MVRCILDDPEFGEAYVVASNAAPSRRRAGGSTDHEAYIFENAGQKFFKLYEASEKDTKAEGSEEGSDGEDEFEECGKGKAKANVSGGILKLSAALKDEKLYPLMGVSEAATQDDIKKAYRLLALQCHPDKLQAATEAETKDIQEKFVKIQEAYEILSDPQKRMIYDSSLPFDDSLPTYSKDSGEDFYEVFAEFFQRNARFSTKRPVPELGNADTPLSDVKKFYEFWYAFSTWRDPLVLAQADGHEMHDLEDAECREEKRWMIRENDRIGKKYKMLEKDRVSSLVSMAEKHDPRIIAEKEAKKAARHAEAERRASERNAEARRKAEAEAKKLAEQEAKRLEEEQKRKEEKSAKEAVKAELRKSRQRLKACHEAVKEFVMAEQLQAVCLAMDKADIDELHAKVEAALKLKKKGVEEATKLLHAAIESNGMTPMIPRAEDVVSTASGTPDEIIEDPAVIEARKAAAEERRKEAEAQKKADEEAAEVARKKRIEANAEKAKKREQERIREEAAANQEQKKLERKEKEKAKKEAEKKEKAEQAEIARRTKVAEEARIKKEAEEAKAAQELEERKRVLEAERVNAVFDEDRLELLSALEPLTDENICGQLTEATDKDESLRGALCLLREADIEEGQRKDCLIVLLLIAAPFWALALEPPPDTKLPTNTRNKVKKARTRLRDAAQNFFTRLPDDFGVKAKKKATGWQRGMVDGLYEWPVWTFEEHEQQLKKRGIEVPSVDYSSLAAPVTKPEAESEAPVPAATEAPKKGKKAQKSTAPEEEDLDALLDEFGLSAPSKKGKKKNNKK